MMNEICGCCEGIEGVTPISTANRPGLDALVYRVGTHATFLETMKASLSSSVPALTNLKTRDANDPAIALLDAWAMVADVLTFYQERIANEGYLRTATERRSVLELARLVGYSLRPGVAATVYPAFTMEVGYNKGSEIPAGTRIQSLPGSGEMPQFFEPAQKIAARADWNNLQPRLTRPHFITQSNANEIEIIYFQGITTNLKPNDPLLFIFGDDEEQVFRQVEAVKPQALENHTQVTLQVKQKKETQRENSAIQTNSIRERKCSFEKIGSADEGLLKGLLTPPSVPPANAAKLGLSPKDTFTCESDIAPQLLATLKPQLQDTLYTAWQNTPVTRMPDLQSTQALRVKTSPFGANAPQKPVYDERGRLQGSEEWAIAGARNLRVSIITSVDRQEAPRLLAALQSENIALTQTATVSASAAQVYIGVTQDGTTASRQILLNGQEFNFEVFLAENKMRFNILREDVPRIRFIHAMASRGAVDVYLNNTKILTGISRFEASNYFTIPQEQNIQVKLTGQQDTILQIDLRMIADHEEKAFSIIAVDTNSAPPHPDDLSPLSYQQVRVRAGNAEPNTVISTVTLSGQTDPIATNLSFRSNSEYTTFDAGNHDITITLNNNQTLTVNNFKFEPETVYDIFLVNQPDSQAGLAVKIYHTPSWLVDESGRTVFQFVELKREFRFISVNTGLLAQVSNSKVLTSPFFVNQTQQYSFDGGTVSTEWGLINQISNLTIKEESPNIIPQERRKIIALDAQYDQITPQSWVVIQRPDKEVIAKVLKTEFLSKVDYGISAKVTQLTLNKDWLEETDKSLQLLRETTIYAKSEELKLAEEAINPTGEPVEGNEIELGTLYDGLQPGKWLIVSGERADLNQTTGVKASELVMLFGVNQRAVTKVKEETQYLYQERPGDRTHTFLQLAQPLNYKYKRDTVTVYGNVVKATHGETRAEVLGSGDSSKTFQQFTLHQPPLTYVAAPTPVGAMSTLEVRVNDLLWHEADSLITLKLIARAYITKTDDNSKTTVIFGNGDRGARLPSGMENVRAVYRSGIGKVGNVKAEQISLLASRPLGLKGVINPLPATGGADRESRDQARKNAPLAVMALDRLVSVSDYADFARTFAGIAKGNAMQLSDSWRQVVHLTIAGVDDIPIDKNSDLYRNLYQALRRFGDPYQPIQVELRELMVLIISAKVKILPDYQWEAVEPEIRQTLLTTFRFEHRELGQDVTFGEVISAIQKVAGVDFVDVDILDAVSETEAANPTTLTKIFQKLAEGKVYSRSNNNNSLDEQPRKRITVNLAKLANNKIQPAQLAVLISTEPRTLLLNPL